MTQKTVTMSLLEQTSRRVGANESFEEATADVMAVLQRHWQLAVGDGETATRWFHRLVEQHTEQQRHYHTLVHLWEMLEYVDSILETLTKDDAGRVLRLATFFHDAIYDPISATNEQDSAELFQQFCRDLHMEDLIQKQVTVLILATERHQVISGDVVDPTLQQVFLDIDMAVLGKSLKAYLSYAALIRKEYAHVPRQIYCEKRATILQGFLTRPIFGSTIFQELLEPQARTNLEAEIQLLQQGVIPGDQTS